MINRRTYTNTIIQKVVFSLVFGILFLTGLNAQTISEKRSIETYTCGSGWGAKACQSHRMTVDLYRPQGAGKAPLVILQHGSGGVSYAVKSKISVLLKQGYAVVVVDAFSSRGISKSHFDFAGIAGKGGNARTMALDSLSVMKSLESDAHINVHETAIVGFSQGGNVGYWLKLKNFIDSTAAPLEGALIMPKVFIAMYGCSGEFNNQFTFNNLPIEVIVGEDDPVLKKCNEFKKRLISSGNPSNVNIFVIKGAHHSFDEREPKQMWAKNQETELCYTVRRNDGSLENPFLNKTYTGQDAETKLRNDCVKYGQVAGNNGNPTIGDQPLLTVLKRYLNTQ